MEEKQKGFTKENMKKLISWQGLKKEGFWILGIGLLLIIAWAYSYDIQQYKNILADKCVHGCYMNCNLQKVQSAYQRKYPDAQVSCYIFNNESIKCEFAGTTQIITEIPRTVMTLNGTFSEYANGTRKYIDEINNISLVPE